MIQEIEIILFFVSDFKWKVNLTLIKLHHILFYGKLTFREEGERMKNRLEAIRKQHGIKQEELANALEVSRQTIGSLENGRYNPSILLAFKIARFFGLSIEEIFIYEEDENV